MLIICLPTPLYQIFCVVILNSKIIVKRTRNPDDRDPELLTINGLTLCLQLLVCPLSSAVHHTTHCPGSTPIRSCEKVASDLGLGCCFLVLVIFHLNLLSMTTWFAVGCDLVEDQLLSLEFSEI